MSERDKKTGDNRATSLNSTSLNRKKSKRVSIVPDDPRSEYILPGGSPFSGEDGPLSPATLNELSLRYENDANIFDLRREIGKSRSMMDMHTVRLGMSEIRDDPRAVLMESEELRRWTTTTMDIVSRYRSMLFNNRYAITVPQLLEVLSRVGEIILTHVTDPVVREAIVMELRGISISQPTPASLLQQMDE